MLKQHKISSYLDGTGISPDKRRAMQKLPAPLQISFANFIKSIENIDFFRPDGRPSEEWRLIDAIHLKKAWKAAQAPVVGLHLDDLYGRHCNIAIAAAEQASRDDAIKAATVTAWRVTRDRVSCALSGSVLRRITAHNAARDAALMARTIVLSDLDYASKHENRSHAMARWRVWQKGYCLYGDLNGILHVYCIAGQQKSYMPLLRDSAI